MRSESVVVLSRRDREELEVRQRGEVTSVDQGRSLRLQADADAGSGHPGRREADESEVDGVVGCIDRSGGIDGATRTAARVAREVAANDGKVRATVLLSPIGSSFDMFNNPFGARGDAFRDAVRDLAYETSSTLGEIVMLCIQYGLPEVRRVWRWSSCLRQPRWQSRQSK